MSTPVKTSPPSALDAAREYTQRGWRVVPIPHGEKGPRIPCGPQKFYLDCKPLRSATLPTKKRLRLETIQNVTMLHRAEKAVASSFCGVQDPCRPSVADRRFSGYGCERP